jgi:hypothetical protein
MKGHTRSMTKTKELSAGATFNTKHVTWLFLAALMTMMLVPVGAQAAQTVSAIITDPEGTNQAEVDDGGNLLTRVTNTPLPVTGSVEVEGTPTVNVAGGSPWHTRDSCTFDGVAANCPISIPSNVVIDTESVEVSLPTGQQARVRLQALSGGPASLFIPVNLQTALGGIGFHTGTLTGLDLAGEELGFINCLRNSSGGGAFCDVSLFGREM